MSLDENSRQADGDRAVQLQLKKSRGREIAIGLLCEDGGRRKGGGARRAKGWVYLLRGRSRHCAHAPSKVKLRELCKMSKGSKVVAISGQDLSSDSCPLVLPYSLSLCLSLTNNTPYMNSNISVSGLTSALRVYLV